MSGTWDYLVMTPPAHVYTGPPSVVPLYKLYTGTTHWFPMSHVTQDDCEISPTKHPYQLALTASRKSLFTGHRWWDDDRHLIDPHLQPVLLMQKPFSGYYFRIICRAQPT